jgi:8-oxo-dGTP pyrophosphatase MutT (NUDIX family)
MDENKNPWQILSQKEVYANKWIKLTEYDVINPNGGKGIYGKVHMNNLAIGVVPLDEAGDTYLVGQYRFVLNQYSWEMPEGGGDPAIDPVESAKRELLEETGLVAKEWNFLLEMHLSNSVTDEHAFIYIARQLEQHAPIPEETEQLVIRKLPFAEAWKMVEEGMITDSMTVAAFQKIRIMQLEGVI